MKKLLLTFLVVLVVIVATGCGGGGEEAQPTGGSTGGQGTAGQSGGGAPPPPPAATSTAQNADEITKPVQFVATAETPSSFKKALAKKKAIVVQFYQAGDPKTTDVAREIAPLKKTFAKHVTFLSYDINNTSTTAAISEQLKAGYAPHFVILDKDAYIVYRHSGFIDRLTLEQQIFSTLRR